MLSDRKDISEDIVADQFKVAAVFFVQTMPIVRALGIVHSASHTSQSITTNRS